MNKCPVTGTSADVKKLPIKPRLNSLVTYTRTGKTLGRVTEVSGSICYVTHSDTGKNDCFIWKHADDTQNTTFDW
jgi:hypothetical protein